MWKQDIISYLIGFIYYVPRPFVNNKVNLLFPHIADASFPSDHAIGTMSIAVGLNKYNRTLGNISILISILVGISRVFVGHHYPIDVVGAYALVFIVNYIYGKLIKDKVQTIYFKVEEYIYKYLLKNRNND
jgi:undecaprenyl-diphosphatase